MFLQIIDQKNRDDVVCSLLSKMSEIYDTLTKAGLRDIESMKEIVERISQQTLECSYFIRACAVNQKFRESIISGFVLTYLTLRIRNEIFQESCFRHGRVCA